jgi:hypothetical protein
MRRMTLRRVADESGGIAMLFAVVATAMLLLVAFVTEVANWLEHRRHLQVQVDAGVLAAGRDFAFCFAAPDLSNQAIKERARLYAGDPAVAGSYNRQVDDPSRVSMVLNGTDYPPTGVDAFTPTEDAARMPCALKSLEIKAKDKDVPTFLSSIVPIDVVDVRARAKVEIRQVTELKGILPWAVPEVNPQTVAAILVNEDDSADQNVIQGLALLQRESAACPGLPSSETNDRSVTLWCGDLTDVPIAPENGVIIFSSRAEYELEDFDGLSVSEACNLPQAFCYANPSSGSYEGVGYIRGYQPTGGSPSATNAVLRNVQFNNLCPSTGTPPSPTNDSAPYFLRTGSCDIGVTADLDFGVANPLTIGAEVQLRGDGCGGNNRCNLAYDAAAQRWVTTTELATISQDSGRNNLTIRWRTTASGSQWHDIEAAHPYAANLASGPIDYFTLTSIGANANSLPIGTRSVFVEVGLRPSLQVGQADDEAVLLRFANASGSLTQSIDCDHDQGFEEEIRYGCLTTYKENTRGNCNPYLPGDPDGQNYPLPPRTPEPWLQDPPEPKPDCAATQTGQVEGPLRDALHLRFEMPCTANNWPDDPVPGPFGNLPPENDPRRVTLMITDYGTFDDSGTKPIPVVKFAGFYVTGWDWDPQKSPGCPENDPHPDFGPRGTYVKGLDDGDVWGHFITEVTFVEGGGESEDLCEFDEVGVCTAVLTE